MIPKRLLVREEILGCELCDLRKEAANGPVPFSGPSPCEVAVMGEAPGRMEDTEGEPFVGPAGRLLREALGKAGFAPDQLFFFNTCCCWPSTTRTPTRDHINACAGNWVSQLELANPRWVLVLGNTALSAIRPGLKISRARRHVFWQLGRYWAPTFHPSAALRSANNERILFEDLEVIHQMVTVTHVNEWDQVVEDWPRWESQSCLKCGTTLEDAKEHGVEMFMDRGGGFWCEDCDPLPFKTTVPTELDATSVQKV